MMPEAQSFSFARRAFTAIGIATFFAILLLVLWLAADVFLLAFAGVLSAVFLRGFADWVSHHTRLPVGWSLLVVLLLLVLAFGGGAWLVGARVAGQFELLSDQMPRALERLQQSVEDRRWARWLVDRAPSLEQLTSGRANIFGRITGVFSGTLGLLANVVIVAFIGLYGAIDPGTYRRGLVRLVPKERRARAWEILAGVGKALRGWLRGQLFAMLVVGISTTLGLWLLGSPLALALGLLAAIFGFVPYVGPLVAAVPAILVALMTGFQQALYVALLYLAIQTIEGYVLTPLVQQRSAKLPAGLTITAMALFGVLGGALGLTLAAPLAAAAVVLVRMLYVEDALRDFGAAADDMGNMAP